MIKQQLKFLKKTRAKLARTKEHFFFLCYELHCMPGSDWQDEIKEALKGHYTVEDLVMGNDTELLPKHQTEALKFRLSLLDEMIAKRKAILTTTI